MKQAATLAIALLVAGCGGPQNYMSAAGPAARDLAALGWFVLVIFIVVSVLVWLLLAWIAVRRRGSLDVHEPIDTNTGQSWILIGGVIVPVIVLATVLGATLHTMGAFPMAHAGDRTPQIRVTGQQWWFNAQYLGEAGGAVNSPTEVHIPVGTAVDIALETRDVIHSFWIPRLHGKVDLVPGQTNHIRIQADRPGTYVGECGEYCGVQHAHMRLMVIAHPKPEYRQWLRAQRAAAAAPTTAAIRRGRAVFEAAACPLCHTVRGTAAQGTIGPELTHLASRQRIAGGMLANNRANLQAWVTQAQQLKPGSQMPDLRQFSGEELQALVTYLQSLR